MPDQRKKAWVDETSFRRFKNAITPPKGGAKGGAELTTDQKRSLFKGLVREFGGEAVR